MWHIFSQLSQAALNMQKDPRPNALPESLPAVKKNARIYALHLDLKPANIFVDRKDENGSGYPQHYPTIRVADFGLSAYSSLEDPRNPTARPAPDGRSDLVGLDWRGTPGFFSPVRRIPYTYCTLADRPLGTDSMEGACLPQTSKSSQYETHRSACCLGTG